MINEKVVALINTQINKELFSAYLYLYFANRFSEAGLDGFAHWYTIQAQEERDHAMLFLKYLQINDAKVVFEMIEKPTTDAQTLLDILNVGLAHEHYVTSLIHAIYDAASSIKDYRTMQFLDWFVKEQCEEEKNATELIKKMKLFGSDPRGLYALDQELGARLYSAPSLVLD